MALPVLESNTFELTLPSSDVKVKYRPFLVKEEKILLQALESQKQKEIIQALKDIVSVCTYGQLSVDELPTFDLEYVFLQIRSKSVGEVAKLKLLCPDDKKTYVEVDINLEDVAVLMDKDHKTNCSLGNDSNGNEVVLELSYPSVRSTLKANEEKNSVESIFYMIKECIAEIHFGEDIYNKVDITDQDLDEFIDSLTQDQFANLQEFFETMPKLKHEVDIVNPNTNVESTVTLEGLSDFLD